jgi:hypothetical protein
MVPIEVVDPEILIVDGTVEEMICGPQDRMCDGDHGLLVTSMPHDAAVACPEGAVFSPDGCKQALREGDLEPAVALAGLTGSVLAGTLVIAGTESRPTGTVEEVQARYTADPWVQLRGPLWVSRPPFRGPMPE